MPDLRSSVFWTILETVATLVASLSMLLVVARIIGPQSFGLASIVFFIGSIAESIISLTFTEPLIQSRNISSRMTDTAFSLMLISSILVYILLIIISPLIELLYNEPMIIHLIAVQGLTCLLLGVRGVPEAILARSMQFRALALRGIAAKTIGASSAIVLALTGAGAWSVILGNVLYSLTAAALVWMMRTQSLSMTINRDDAAALIRFGRFSFADAVLTTVSARIYGLLIAYFYDIRTFGQISVAFRLNDTIVSLLAQTVTRLALPFMSSISDDRNLIFRNWLSGTRIIMLITIPTMLGLAAVGPDIIETMLGAAWKGAAPALAAISIYSAFNLSAVLIGPLIKSVGQPAKLMIIHACTISFLIGATIISSVWGIYASLTVYSMLGLIYWVASMRILYLVLHIDPVRNLGFSSLKILFSALFMALSVSYGRLYFETVPAPYRLSLLIAAGIIIYVSTTAAINRGILKELLRWRAPRV